jgi:hypothetical protein
VNYTTVLTDAGGMLIHPAADTTSRTFTIDSNANVPYPLHTFLWFCNLSTANLTIAINADTLIFNSAAQAGGGIPATGSRTLATNGIALAIKVTATSWIISSFSAKFSSLS